MASSFGVRAYPLLSVEMFIKPLFSNTCQEASSIVLSFLTFSMPQQKWVSTMFQIKQVDYSVGAIRYRLKVRLFVFKCDLMLRFCFVKTLVLIICFVVNHHRYNVSNVLSPCETKY